MILDEIVKDKRLELHACKQTRPLSRVKRAALERPATVDLVSALLDNRLHIIAEVKRASPSRGLIVQDFNPLEIARTYAACGAAAISVVTETKHFQGSLDDLKSIDCSLPAPRPPLLRKDFIFDPYQVYETLACGADALLLIAAILEPQQLRGLIDLSHELNLACLVEAHTASDVEVAVKSGARIIGINNRDLRTFKVDLHTTERLISLVPRDRVVVSESGIRNKEDIDRLKDCGVRAVLIGEFLLSAPSIEAKMKELHG